VTDAADLAVVARVRRAHGIRGELALEMDTDEPDAILASGRRVFAGRPDGRPHPATVRPDGTLPVLTVASARPAHDTWLVHFAEIPDRTAAEKWRGHALLVPLDELPPPDEDEVYIHDLIGLAALDCRGAALGTVTDVYELPQGLMLGVDTPRGEVLVPFHEALVVETDVPGGRLVLDPPAGLFEL
jgi:16S rRNA processing protein RimM